jgi:hypothetical protein
MPLSDGVPQAEWHPIHGEERQPRYRGQEELISLGSRSTPTFKIGAEILIGFSPSRILKALGR